MVTDTDVAGVPSLPTLGTGITLLDGAARGTGVVHSLVVDHLCIRRGGAIQPTIAFWAETLSKRQQVREALRQEVIVRGAD